jgi:pimeloyl-ACP methyl ester carboxylesterase
MLILLAIYIMVSLYADYHMEIQQARLRITTGGSVIRTSLGPVEYAAAGSGDPVIVIHGAGGGYDQGLLVSEAWLGHGYRRIAVSRFGYLNSTLPANASYALQADIIVELMDSLRIPEAVIMGLSAGGPSSILLASRHPQRCRALILVSAISREISELSWYHNIALDLVFDSDLLYWVLINYLPSSFYTAFGIPPDVQANLTPAQHDSISYFLHSILPISMRKPGTAYDRIVRELDLPVDSIRSSILVIHARDDNIVPFSNAEHVTEEIPEAVLLAVPTGGHLLIGHYGQIRRTIEDFLTHRSNIDDTQ